MLSVESLGVLACEALQIAHIADGGHPVGVCEVGDAEELLEHAADRTALGPHSPFFLDHVAFAVELAQYGVEEPLALEVGEQFELVGR